MDRYTTDELMLMMDASLESNLVTSIRLIAEILERRAEEESRPAPCAYCHGVWMEGGCCEMEVMISTAVVEYPGLVAR